MKHGNVFKGPSFVNVPLTLAFGKLTPQLDTFYNSLNSNDQDALDSTAGDNFLDKMPQEGLAIIESKSKVCYSRSRANDSRVTSLEDKMTIKMKQMMNEMKALVVTTPAPIKAIEEKADDFQKDCMLRNEAKAITTRSGVSYDGPPIHSRVVEKEREANKGYGSGYQQKDRKQSQNDKTEHEMEKTVQNQGQSPKMSKSESILKNQQSNRSRN
ncbi:hypothetical protein Tco_0449991 [Tanacetum coccineum]